LPQRAAAVRAAVLTDKVSLRALVPLQMLQMQKNNGKGKGTTLPELREEFAVRGLPARAPARRAGP
jgi:hypothetical protein